VRRPLWIATILVALAQCLVPPDVAAGIAVSPLQQEVTVEPGGSAQFSVRVTNVRREPNAPAETITVEPVDFSVSQDGTLSFGEACKHGRSAVPWMSLDVGELVLQPGEARDVRGTVTAPFQADGDYWAAILVTLGRPTRQQGAVDVVLRTACGVFVGVSGRNKAERLSISDLEATLPSFGPAAPSGPQEDAAPLPEALEQARALRVSADVTNAGAIKFVASGTVSLYLEGRRWIATIPLHAHRRRILPGDTRRFVGVMPAPLPAGSYTLQWTFEAGPGHTRKAFERTQIEIAPQLARLWQEYYAERPPVPLAVEPGELEQTVTAGRFTVMSVVATNNGDATMRLRCWLEPDTLPAGWLGIEPTEFTLGPRMRRSVLCRVTTPGDAPPGEYTGILVIQAESAGLLDEDSVQLHRVPLRILIGG